MKINSIFKRIPRPLKAIVCTVLVIFLGIYYYIALGCPTLTLTQEFRRAEKANMVGPSTIVDRLSHSEYSEFEELLVAETEEGICFFGRYCSSSSDYGDPFSKKKYLLNYIRKTGDLTIVAVPNVWGGFWGSLEYNRSLPVYLFADNPDAVRAKVMVTVSGSYTDTSGDTRIERTYTQYFGGETERSDDGYFRYTFSSNFTAGRYALYHLSNATGGEDFGLMTNDTYLATVWLYDEAGNLIEEREIIVGNPYGTPATP